MMLRTIVNTILEHTRPGESVQVTQSLDSEGRERTYIVVLGRDGCVHGGAIERANADAPIAAVAVAQALAQYAGDPTLCRCPLCDDDRRVEAEGRRGMAS